MKLDTVGCYVNSPNAIETFSGRFVDISAITPEMIDIEDIAHSLSLQCRYNGHCKHFYSVAEHSCYVADVVESECCLYRNLDFATLAALLHDGSESYLCDIPRPVKPLLRDYATLESSVQSAINAKFSLHVCEILHGIIKVADNRVLKAEAQQLMRSRGEHWGFGFQEVVPADIHIACWSPERAEREFLERFERWI